MVPVEDRVERGEPACPPAGDGGQPGRVVLGLAGAAGADAAAQRHPGAVSGGVGSARGHRELDQQPEYREDLPARIGSEISHLHWGRSWNALRDDLAEFIGVALACGHDRVALAAARQRLALVGADPCVLSLAGMSWLGDGVLGRARSPRTRASASSVNRRA